MSRKLISMALAVLITAALCHAQTNEQQFVEEVNDDTFDLVIGGGFVISPGYQDYIDDVYESFGYSDSGGDGWLDLYAGVEIRPAEQFGILIGCDILINAVDVASGLLDESYVNIIMVPSVYGQLYLTEDRMFYINGGISLPLPESGSDYFEFENDGLGFGANIGVEVAETVRIEAGYTYVPVKAKATSSNPFLTGEADYNFGGPQIRLLLAF